VWSSMHHWSSFDFPDYLCIPLSCGDLWKLLFVNCGQFLFYIQLGTDFVAKIVAPARRKLVQILKSSMLMMWYKKSCSKWTFKHQKSFYCLLYILLYYQHHRISHQYCVKLHASLKLHRHSFITCTHPNVVTVSANYFLLIVDNSFLITCNRFCWKNCSSSWKETSSEMKSSMLMIQWTRRVVESGPSSTRSGFGSTLWDNDRKYFWLLGKYLKQQESGVVVLSILSSKLHWLEVPRYMYACYNEYFAYL
jgi:hypothetical protein